jgi:hypothetical protein
MGAFVLPDSSNIVTGLKLVLDNYNFENIGRYNLEFARKTFSSDIVSGKLEKILLDVALVG